MKTQNKNEGTHYTALSLKYKYIDRDNDLLITFYPHSCKA